MQDDYFFVLPTLSAFCDSETYISKKDELAQLESFLAENDIDELEMVLGSSIGVEIAMEFISSGAHEFNHGFIDGGMFAKIGGLARKMLAPVLYKTIGKIDKTNGDSLKEIFWTDEDEIKPYFVEAARNLDKDSMNNMMKDMLTKDAYPKLSPATQQKMVFEFGTSEDHFKYRKDVMRSYPNAAFPVFKKYDHMQYQIEDPEGFAQMLRTIIETGEMPKLPMLR
ncbi:MAG: hypothetical protein Q3982_02660 [Phoenicibacter congonensis]|uniref:Alpha/beta hydrolase n=1 Tax=Phoenicibacter congonensis TaxID=1944646 RepID=A0AA43U8V2_9ACTN|nr:hypothetical protein [Phoenicibacter congonensis]